MLRRNDGHIITMASMLGIMGAGSLTAYCSSKGAAVLFHDSLHHELDLLESKVRTSVVCPGYIATAMSAALKGFSTFLYPKLSPQQVAAAIVSAVDKKSSQDIYMPWFVTTLPSIAILPMWVRDIVKRNGLTSTFGRTGNPQKQAANN
ncbi:hypothetical protein THASP1DRAFT_19240 [Thamnocephalis sphaerospora]|uniref:Uncharacterized protein n=1 Tax=Thamnocephalis sphaerospora TaxID=78915 RepID=A0A4P9XJC8_9FUNG|nr:hypothetical protein THASP1DRAFT_19240 [Thamnocephalis sphaerospora]|eukprot:RKP05863.1 hypothetical protein THASP1DRAFT_19240 [Thamnocephalis sphaerospora]